MSAVAVFPSLVPLFIVVAMKRAEARIHRQLAGAGAVTAESAIRLSPGRSLERRRLQGLIRGGAVRLTADGRHFLDANGWTSYRRNRRRRALFAMSALLALFGVAIAVVSFMR